MVNRKMFNERDGQYQEGCLLALWTLLYQALAEALGDKSVLQRFDVLVKFYVCKAS